MEKALIDEYSQEELEKIVKHSTSYKEVARKIGYTAFSGSQLKTLKSRFEKFNISTEHFSRKTPVIRTEENIFVQNSTAAQKTLRDWYIKGKYSKYECSICGQPPIWQDKELTLILDHINGVNNDDRLENLRWVCPNCNQQLDTTNGKNRKILNKKNYCVDCGKEINLKSIRCITCSNKNQVIPLENMLVTREELKELIRTTPFTQIGRKYGVSDNAIRKWCDKFNLPRKTSDIKKYSDADWSKI